MYGSTEVAFVSRVAGPGDLQAAPTSAGRVLRGVSVRSGSTAKGGDVEPGEVGRICVASALAIERYTSGEAKATHDGLSATGDLGRFGADGRLYVAGREDDMIVSGGENVFPAEVEGALQGHPDVVEVAVVGVADATFGQALVAHVVCRDGSSTSAEELRAYVKATLAAYKVPRAVVFHDELPRNETGKVVKRMLTER